MGKRELCRFRGTRRRGSSGNVACLVVVILGVMADFWDSFTSDTAASYIVTSANFQGRDVYDVRTSGLNKIPLSITRFVDAVMPPRLSPGVDVLLVTSAFPWLSAVALQFPHRAKIVGVALPGKQTRDAFPNLTLASGVGGGDHGDAVPGPGGGDVGREEACRGDGRSARREE